MSEGRNVPQRPTANRSWLLSEPAKLAINRSLLPRVQLDTACANLETRYSSDSESEQAENVITEREFPFTSFDASLFTTDPIDQTRIEQKRLRPFISRTPSNVSLRREFSLTSYDSDVFDPKEYYRENSQKMSVTRTPTDRTTNAPQDLMDMEMPRPNTQSRRLARQASETERTPYTATQNNADNNTEILNLLREMRTEINALHGRITHIENRHRK